MNNHYKMRVSALLAVLSGIALRVFFVRKFPLANSGDSPFYIELAWNWLKNGIYGFEVGGRLTAVDMRVPGYPAFLAAVFAVAGQSIRAAMLAQIAVDVGTCFVVALIAARLAPVGDEGARRRVALAALWIACLCPFTANYTAVVLTETLVTLLCAVAILVLLEPGLLGAAPATGAGDGGPARSWMLAGIVVGFGTLVRPETPLLMFAAGLMLIVKFRHAADWTKLARALALLAVGLALPLLPWIARNWHAFHEWQPLAPRYSELPGEYAPLGFNAWTNTWLWKFGDIYDSTWKLDEESISIDDIPATAFDSPDERARVAKILEDYNNTLTLSREQDRQFGEIARERTRRHPLRTYLRVPLLRSLTLWFTPRVELLPFSGHLFPLREEWRDDRKDFEVTLTLVAVNALMIALAVAGAWMARGRPGWALLIVYIALRTWFFTVFVETPEPRYVLECFPAVLALAAQVWSRPGKTRWSSQLSSTGSG